MTPLRSAFAALACLLPLGACQTFPGDAPTPLDDRPRVWSFPYYGEMIAVGFDFCPVNWVPANGAPLRIADFNALFALTGTAYGGDGRTNFNVPDMRGRMPMGADTAHPRGYHGNADTYLTGAHIPAHPHHFFGAIAQPNTANPQNAMFATFGTGSVYANDLNQTVALGAASLATTGGGLPVSNRHPYQAMTMCVAATGAHWPPHPTLAESAAEPGGFPAPVMTDRNIGDIFMTSSWYCPASFFPTDGRYLNSSAGDSYITSYFALIGQTFGGDGPGVFAIPNLLGRSPVGMNPNSGDDRPMLARGDKIGAQTVTLQVANLPTHSHQLRASTEPPEADGPGDHFVATFPGGSVYAPSTETDVELMALNAVGSGGSDTPQAFDITAPVTSLTSCVAIYANYPQPRDPEPASTPAPAPEDGSILRRLRIWEREDG